MVATVHVLQPRPTAVGHDIGLGHTGHRILETLRAAGRLPIGRVMVDAAHPVEREGLLSLLRGSGTELVTGGSAVCAVAPRWRAGSGRIAAERGR